MICDFDFSFDSAGLLAGSIKILIESLCNPVGAIFSFLLELESCQHCNFEKTVKCVLFYISTICITHIHVYKTENTGFKM